MSGVIPSAFALHKKELLERLELIEEFSRTIHVDLMDGHFTKHKGPSLKDVDWSKHGGKVLEAHLMVKKPLTYVEDLAKDGFRRVIAHVETMDAEQVLAFIKACEHAGMEPVIAKNPGTPLDRLDRIPPEVALMLMGEEPGKEGQSLVESVHDELRDLRAQAPNRVLEVDGGVNEDTIEGLVLAGADHLVVGSAISAAKDPRHAYEELTRLWEEAVARE